METINFKIQGQHESHSGIANVFDSFTTGREQANLQFNGRQPKINRLNDVRVGTDTYSVYECYVDSGSDDYYYFAIQV